MNDCYGVCPTCRQTDGYINIGASHWFFCKEHKVCWRIGSNLFGRWRDQTREDQEQIFDRLDFGSYKEIDEWHSPESIAAMQKAYPPEPSRTFEERVAEARAMNPHAVVESDPAYESIIVRTPSGELISAEGFTTPRDHARQVRG